MQLTTDSCDPQSLEPRPKKQRTKQMEKSLTDPNETKCFDASCFSHSFEFPEELQEPCDTSTLVWKTCFHCVAERGFHFHENVDSPSFPEGVMTIQLAAIHMSEEIKKNLAMKTWTHLHTFMYTFARPQLLIASNMTAVNALPNKERVTQTPVPREAGLLLSSALGKWRVVHQFLRGSYRP